MLDHGCTILNTKEQFFMIIEYMLLWHKGMWNWHPGFSYVLAISQSKIDIWLGLRPETFANEPNLHPVCSTCIRENSSAGLSRTFVLCWTLPKMMDYPAQMRDTLAGHFIYYIHRQLSSLMVPPPQHIPKPIFFYSLICPQYGINN